MAGYVSTSPLHPNSFIGRIDRFSFLSHLRKRPGGFLAVPFAAVFIGMLLPHSVSAEASSDARTPSEMMYDPSEPPPGETVELDEDPLDPAETRATIAVIDGDPAATEIEEQQAMERVEALLDRMKPYGKGDMELALGIGMSGYSGFTISAGAIFAYYLINRLAPGLEIDYQATFGDVKYPQSLTVFPFLKYVLIRSDRFAPYLLYGGGRTFEWGGVENGFHPETGDFDGYAPVSSWVTGLGGGFIIGIGSRARIQIQLLAMYRVFDETVWKDVKIRVNTNETGEIVYEITGEQIDRLWYPAPSFWFSFAL